MKNKEIASYLRTIGDVADREGVDLYAVGGYVRDMILQRETDEIDFVAEGDAPALARETCRSLHGHGFVVYEKFGTASFMLDGWRFEFVTARAETYHAESRNPEIRQSTLEEDLQRRDFTVNALAMRVNRKGFGDVLDPFDGRRDIKRKLIRTPLDPGSTFSDDPLRIMRAARFASQLNFHIDAETLAAMGREKERLKIVSQERITAELLKILSHPKPSIGLRMLQDTGVLEIIFPELASLAGVEQRDDYHHKDVFAHTLKVVDNAAAMSDNLLLRFSALVHDLGKPAVKRFEKGQGWTFHSHELVGERLLNGICRRLKLSNDYKNYSKKLTRLHMRPIQLIGEEVTDSAVRRLLVQAGDDVEALMTLCRADITSGNPHRVRKHLANFDHVVQRMQEVEEKDKMRAFQSPVRGDEIMRICGLEPGPVVGKIKKQIEEAILEGTIPNDYEAALTYLREIKDQYIPGH